MDINNPQDETVKTYCEKFLAYKEKTIAEVGGDAKKWIDAFCSMLPVNGEILEFGSATGRDARYLRSKGFKVLCTDIIPEALEDLKNDGFQTAEFDFRDEPKVEWMNKFDGFFANGVFLHASEENFTKILQYIPNILKEKGFVAFSLKFGQGEEISMHKMDAPRFFKYYNKEELKNIFSKYSYKVISLELLDHDKWLTVILQKVS